MPSKGRRDGRGNHQRNHRASSGWHTKTTAKAKGELHLKQHHVSTGHQSGPCYCIMAPLIVPVQCLSAVFGLPRFSSHLRLVSDAEVIHSASPHPPTHVQEDRSRAQQLGPVLDRGTSWPQLQAIYLGTNRGAVQHGSSAGAHRAPGRSAGLDARSQAGCMPHHPVHSSGFDLDIPARPLSNDPPVISHCAPIPGSLHQGQVQRELDNMAQGAPQAQVQLLSPTHQ